MNLKCILLSERSQAKKATYYTIPMIWHSETSKTILMEKVAVRGSRGEGKYDR